MLGLLVLVWSPAAPAEADPASPVVDLTAGMDFAPSRQGGVGATMAAWMQLHGVPLLTLGLRGDGFNHRHVAGLTVGPFVGVRYGDPLYVRPFAGVAFGGVGPLTGGEGAFWAASTGAELGWRTQVGISFGAYGQIGLARIDQQEACGTSTLPCRPTLQWLPPRLGAFAGYSW